MISLIAGKYKGKKLYHIKNKYVRPTQAKIRKSMFQILEPFEDLEILDLYAGVGTLGLEAISRGACRAIFVEKDRHAYRILQKNITLFDSDKITVFCEDVNQYISRYEGDKFDIIFADPPYRLTNYSFLIEKVQKMLKPDGIFCMEMKKQAIEESYSRIKYYGNTQVVFFNIEA